MIHLHEPMSDVEDEGIYSRTNGISVVTLNEQGKLIERKKKLLQYRNFPDSFKIENVVLSTGENIGVGNVLVPFYPDGYSDNVIIHILVNEEEQWSVRIYKLGKEAKIFPDYINFNERV